MSSEKREKILVDRGMMTESEETKFNARSQAYHRDHRNPDGSLLDKSYLAPFYGKHPLQFHRRRRSYLAFRHESIIDLVYSISNQRPEIIKWSANASEKHSLIISQPHEGTFFAVAWRKDPLGDYTSPILKLLSSHTEVLSIYSTSNTDPCSFQRWKDGKCARAIEWIPNNESFGEVIDFGQDGFNDPTYEGRPWYDDVNRALELSGHAGHLIPPRKSKDEEVFAWKIYLPDILK